nr:protein kinase [Dendronalium sp. ChiSLP03b]MDZ8209341.1 protein kinase [Dendronalium sp. ChiSLP03b]
MKLQPGHFLKFSNYTIEKQLDSGGFGIAYLAKNKYGNLVVIKILKDIDVNDPNFNKLRQDFLNEALRLKECIHTHIVKIHEILIEEDLLGIVMEYIEGENLCGQVLPESEALKYIYQIGDALTVMHENQLLHQDVKPANIILRKGKEEVVLIDFGISRNFNPEITQTYTVQHSDFYAPPELYESRTKRGPYTDVYCLAATLYKLLTGQEPESSISRHHYGCKLKPPKEIKNQISENTNLCILLGLELNPNDRPKSIKEWLEMLASPIDSPKIQLFLNQRRIQKNIRRLLSDLSDDLEQKYHIRAINDLAEFGAEAKNAIPELVKLLKHNQENYSQSAESTLEKIGLPAIPALTEILKNKYEDIQLRRRVATIIKKISKNTKEVIPELIEFAVELMENEDAEIRWYAVVTIGEIEIGLKGLYIVPFLIKRLTDDKKGIRAYAAFALGRIGQSAKDAISHLLEKVKDYNESQEVFIASLEALDSIGFEIEDIKITFISEEGIPEEVVSGKEVVISYREEQQKLRDEARKKPGIHLELRRPLSAHTPPQLCFDPQQKSER